jgi:glycosyltransferase involved in cell wall biosynthesis
LGGIARIKGIFELIEALHLLKQRGLRFRCLMPGCDKVLQKNSLRHLLRKIANRIGMPSDTFSIRKKIRKYELSDYCKLMPFDRDIPRLLAASDILVFPSTEPHFARPVVEAAALGKPVVASDLDGVRELVEHEITGLLVPSGDVPALTNSLETLINDPAKQVSMGKRARKKAEMCFDSKVQIMKIQKEIQKILQNDH